MPNDHGEDRVRTEDMISKNVKLTRLQFDKIAEEATRLGIGANELIRRIVDQHFTQTKRLDRLERNVDRLMADLEGRQGALAGSQ